MFVRLAFAVQACVEPDILIVDEALAVGDVFFRQKCYQRLNALREKGTAILLVTHGMGDVEQFCERALLLDHGVPLFFGDATEAVKRYYLFEQKTREVNLPSLLTPEASDNSCFSSDASFIWPEKEAYLNISHMAQVSNGWAKCTHVALCDESGRKCSQFSQGELACFFYEFESLTDIETPIAGVTLQNDKGVIVHGKNTLQFDTHVPTHIKKGQRIRFCHQIKLDIAWGEYTFEVGFACVNQQHYKKRSVYSQEQLDSFIIRICHLSKVGYFAVIAAATSAHTSLLHHGIANLPGSLNTQLLE
jgi:lipopolysaccharide transport system ATP-binding protein